MIQVEEITICEFRGIRKVVLPMKSKSFVVWGPNGSGKSGVVDALDFALTGDIARLSGSGSGGLSVSQHGPHVHRRNDPAAAFVSLKLKETSTDKVATLTRSVRTPNAFDLEPEIKEVKEAVLRMSQHREVTLTRKEILKYIVARPGERAQQVQALLKLDRVESVRQLLRSVKTRMASLANSSKGSLADARGSLQRHLDIIDLSSESILKSVNEKREILGLPSLHQIDSGTRLDSGLERQVEELERFNRATALQDVQELYISTAGREELASSIRNLVENVGKLEQRPELAYATRSENLLRSAIDLIVDNQCPLCGLEWPTVEQLRTHVEQEIQKLSEAKKARDTILRLADDVIAEYRTILRLVETVKRYSSRGPEGLVSGLDSLAVRISERIGELGTIEGATAAARFLADESVPVSNQFRNDIEALISAIESEPDQTVTHQARSYLTVAQDRLKTVRNWVTRSTKHERLRAAIDRIYDSYCDAANNALTALYTSVEEEFSKFYQKVNSDDEGTFRAELQPSSGKLNLKVDFYGLGMFPPAAYHSEGHQDGMGICLWLALVKHQLGTEFKLAIMDDVVSSVDRGHRRQFCDLLVSEFPETQFVITTHDQVWSQQMRATGLVDRSGQAHFQGWTVDDGPIYEPAAETWDRIRQDLDKNEVPAAAAKLRRHIEFSLGILAENLRSNVPYKSDPRYDLGELLASVNSRYGKLIEKSIAAARSWGNATAATQANALKLRRSTIIPAQQSENWAVNSAVHFNSWIDLSPQDFLPVVDSWRDYLDLYKCDNGACDGYVYLVRKELSDEEMRCACGSFNFNLRRK